MRMARILFRCPANPLLAARTAGKEIPPTWMNVLPCQIITALVKHSFYWSHIAGISVTAEGIRRKHQPQRTGV